MAEGDITCTNQFKKLLLQGDVDLVNDILKVALVTSAYSFNVDNNHGYANFSANEITGAGYSAGGETLATKTVTQDQTNDRAKFDAADITWTSLATQTALAHALIYDDTLTAAPADTLLMQMQITTQPNGNNFTIQWNATTGILLLS